MITSSGFFSKYENSLNSIAMFCYTSFLASTHARPSIASSFQPNIWMIVIRESYNTTDCLIVMQSKWRNIVAVSVPRVWVQWANSKTYCRHDIVQRHDQMCTEPTKLRIVRKQNTLQLYFHYQYILLLVLQSRFIARCCNLQHSCITLSRRPTLNGEVLWIEVSSLQALWHCATRFYVTCLGLISHPQLLRFSVARHTLNLRKGDTFRPAVEHITVWCKQRPPGPGAEAGVHM